jgi:Ca-activated chloride channel family protein
VVFQSEDGPGETPLPGAGAPLATELVDIPAPAEQSILDDIDELLSPSSSTGPVAEWQALVQGGLRPYDDVILMQWGLLGAPQYAEDDLPELVRVSLPPSSGLELPLTRGYDRRFLLKEGVFPPISPAADPKLQSLDIPITTSTATLDLAAVALAAGKLPRGDEVRVEHFLAGLDSRFPAATRGRLALHVQGSPSPFGVSDAWLVQLGVQAGKLRRLGKQPTHLVVAVDISASMARGGRIDMVRHAVNQMHGQLAAGDALSLVAFEEEVVCRAEYLNSSQGDELREQLRNLTPRGGTNLAAGLQTAASIALNEPLIAGNQNYRTRLVLITDSRAAMPDDTSKKLREVMAITGQQGIGFDVLDVSGRTSPDPLLEQMTVELSGTYRTISSRQQLYASLVESLAGHTPAVANEAQLRIRFNKDAIAAYRLLGHEPNLVAAVVPAAIDARLLPEEASSTLLELWLKDTSASDLGVVSLTWKDPHTGQRFERKVPLQRRVFASSFGETPASFQTAAVAAEIAEQLRGSREALRREKLILGESRNNVSTIRNVIRPWSLTLRQEPDVARLLSLMDQMEKVRGR